MSIILLPLVGFKLFLMLCSIRAVDLWRDSRIWFVFVTHDLVSWLEST